MSELPQRNSMEKYTCYWCKAENFFDLDEYDRCAMPLSDLYMKKSFISRSELVINKVAEEPYFPHEKEQGYLLLWRMGASYACNKCENCSKLHFMVYGMDEVQPSRYEVQISGIWSIEKDGFWKRITKNISYE